MVKLLKLWKDTVRQTQWWMDCLECVLSTVKLNNQFVTDVLQLEQMELCPRLSDTLTTCWSQRQPVNWRIASCDSSEDRTWRNFSVGKSLQKLPGTLDVGCSFPSEMKGFWFWQICWVDVSWDDKTCRETWHGTWGTEEDDWFDGYVTKLDGVEWWWNFSKNSTTELSELIVKHQKHVLRPIKILGYYSKWFAPCN